MKSADSIAALARWTLFAGYLGLTVYLSSQSHVRGADRFPDYVLHSAEFFVMTLLLVHALSGRFFRPHSPSALLAALGFGITYGVVDEWHQSFVPGRESSVRDAAVDAAATGVTVLALAWISRKRAATSAAALDPAPEQEAHRSRGARDTSLPQYGTMEPGESGESGESRETRAGADSAPGPDIEHVPQPRCVLVTKEDCHLCDEAKQVLRQVLGEEGEGWSAIDIASSPELGERYRFEIPVLLVDGIKRFKGRIDPERLERLLGDRGRMRRGTRGA